MKQDSEIDYRSIFDSMPDGLAYCKMIFDSKNQPADFVFVEVNKNYEKLTGMEGVMGKRMMDLFPEIKESNSKLFEACARVSLTGFPERIEIYITSLAKWFLISMHSSRKEYFTAVIQNITKQKQIEEDLEKARIAARNVLEDLQVEKETLAHEKAKDEAMLASIGDGVIIVDLYGKITFINQLAQDSLGFKSAEIMGKFLSDVILIEDEKGELVAARLRPMTIDLARVGVDNIQDNAEPSTNTISQVYYYVRKDKTKFPVSMTFSRVLLDNKIVGAIEVFRDITKEREIDKAKSEFVSLASHQLKTPPTAIKLLTERLLNKRIGTLTEKQTEYFDDIRSNNQRMIDLINALLHVSRIELGAFTIQLKKKNMCELLQTILYELKPAINKKHLIFKEAHQKECATLLIDESLFRMVVNNLIINAIHYTPEKGTINIDCKEMDKGKMFGNKSLQEDCFTISVADTGYGIPKRQQKNIFTKFFRADNAREKQPDGTGLGLYIVKSILDNSGGSVWFNSEENKGTAFYVTIPMTGMRSKK